MRATDENREKVFGASFAAWANGEDHEVRLLFFKISRERMNTPRATYASEREREREKERERVTFDCVPYARDAVWDMDDETPPAPKEDDEEEEYADEQLATAEGEDVLDMKMGAVSYTHLTLPTILLV